MLTGGIPSELPVLCLTALSPTVLAIQAMCTLLQKADCENLCHISRNKTRALADMNASNFSLITSGTQLRQLCWVTGKKQQLADHLVGMILQHGGWHHAQVPLADPHPVPKVPTPRGSDIAL